jgi:putative glutamine amidotransferase
MGAPVIGLTTYREDATWGVWRQRADLLPRQYADAVEATGGVPVLRTPSSRAWTVW